MKNVFFLFLIVGKVAMASFSGEGGWSSGGGNLPSFTKNPWFLQNTKNVSTCLIINESAMSVSREQALISIRKAIDFWKENFKKEELTGGFHIKLGTQVFINDVQGCQKDKHYDLVFNLGNKEELPFEVKENIVGHSYLTHYNKKQMRGRGIIYIADPDSINPIKDKKQIWSEGNLERLELILRHELGHIFAIPHSNSFLNMSSLAHIMDEDFPYMLVKSDISDIQKYMPRMSVFTKLGKLTEKKMWKRCFNTDSEFPYPESMPLFLQEFFSIPHEIKCISAHIKNPHAETIPAEVIFKYYREENSSGETFAKMTNKGHSITSFQSPIRIVLTKEQTLFQQDQKEFPFVWTDTYGIKFFIFDGNLQTSNGSTQFASMSFRDNVLSFDVYDNKQGYLRRELMTFF